MRLGFAIFFQCIVLTVCAHFYNTEESPVLSAIEGDPSVTVDRCINPISGDYVISESDLVIPGIEPLHLSRTYLSGAQKGRDAHWSLLPHLYMHFTFPKNPKKEHTIISVAEPSGSSIHYKNLVADNGKDRKQFFPMLGKATRGITNTARGEICARTNIANNYIVCEHDIYIFTSCDGTKRYYKHPAETARFAYLEKERKPNGNWVYYEYNQDYYTLREIRTTNPSSTKIYAKIQFEHQNPNPYNSKTFSVVTSQNQRLHYFFHLDDVRKGKHNEHSFRLNCIARPHFPHEKLHYHEIPQSDHTFLITNRKFDDQTINDIRYYESGANTIANQNVIVHGEKDPAIRRVKSLDQPVAPDGSLARTHSLTYRLGKYARNKKNELQNHLSGIGFTDCIDAYNKKTIYSFNDFFVPLYTIKYGTDLNHPQNGEEIPLFTEHFVWSYSGFINLLKSKYYADKDQILSVQYFEYDHKGNITEESLIGNISGRHTHATLFPECKNRQEIADTYSVKTTYSHDLYSCLLSKEFPNGCTYHYEYLPNTNLLTARFTLCHGAINKREFHVYNEDNILIEFIQDDGTTRDRNNLTGVTVRLVRSIQPKQSHPALNFPEVIEEKYFDFSTNTYQLLKKVILHYAADCTVVQEDVYDASGQHAYSTQNLYDEKRRLIQTVDPLGRTSYFHYNGFNQIVEQQAGNSALKVLHSQDILGREFATATIDTQGTRKESRTYYDLKSRVIQRVDAVGNVSSYSYDDLDHETMRTLPLVEGADSQAQSPVVTTINDVYGRPLQSTDPLGHTTSFSYNVLGKPIAIHHPDHIQEQFSYNLDGSLATHISATGLNSHLTYDALGRVTHKRISSQSQQILYEETFTYNALHLLSHTDQKGVKTLYNYDGSGRKIETSKHKDDEFIGKEEYSYDALGRHCKTITHDETGPVQVYIQTFDLANRVIQERREDATGRLFAKVEYQYDRYDNKICILTSTDTGISIEKFTYDDYKRVTSYTDAEGNTSYTEYKDRLYNSNTHSYEHEITVTDPKGRQIKERYSSTDLLVSRMILNALGIPQSQESFYYDLNRNKVKQANRVFAQQELLREVTTLWEYDSHNRVITLIEAYGLPIQKVSRFTYTSDGKEKLVTQPNGVTLEYTYDELSRLISLHSSDDSVHYQFLYNQSGELIEEKNLLTQESTYRSYNARGQVIKETLANSLSVTKSYDDLGRAVSLTLSDSSQIHYTFDAFHLKKVSRYSSSESLRYEHHYLNYNLQHQPLQESTIFNVYSIDHTYDALGRHNSLSSPHYTESIEQRDPCGNILQLHTQSALSTADNSYIYDELDHLITENGFSQHQYRFDSHHNRIEKDNVSYLNNELSQLLQEGSSTYEYTQNGNRAAKKVGNQNLLYTYDALNRLTSLKNDSIEVLFTYDSWHRRLSKTVKQKSFLGYWSIAYEERYLYDQEKEIGAVDATGAISHLKVLGLGKGGDIGAAVAIELHQKPYIPMHDLFGNIVQLIDAEHNYVAESYRYSTFGESTLYSYYHFTLRESSLGNPWRYQSKRTDDESGLVFFGRRYYDPKVGSWISEDPLGLTQGPSLYHFLLANPLSNVDIYGLSAAARDEEEPLQTRPTTGSRIDVSPIEDNPYKYTPWITTPQGYESPRRTPFPKTLDHTPAARPNFSVCDAPVPNPRYSYIFINGIDTTLTEAHAMRDACARYLEHPVDVFYNPTTGNPIKDIGLVTNNFMRISSSLVSNFKRQLMYEINLNKDVFIFGHSGGGSIIYNVLESLSSFQREKVYVITFGSAKFIPKGFAKSAINYVSRLDLVSIASNYYALGIDSSLNDDEFCPHEFDIRWLPINSRNPLKEHSFMGKTYQKELQTICESINLKGFPQ